MTRWSAVLVLLFAAVDGAVAQTPEPAPAPGSGDAVKALIGSWEFANSGRDKVCTVRFRPEPAASGMRIEFDRTCAGLFGFVADVAGWTIASNDFLRLVDARGQSVLEFSEVESGVFEAPKLGEGILFIQKPTAAPAQRTAADISGEWVIARGNRAPICTLVLGNTPAGEDLTLQVRQPCNALVTQFGPTAWRIDSDELVLRSARGQAWRFEETEPGVWRRVPAAANPVLLIRK